MRNNNLDKQNKLSAFTLIELLIVLVIMVIVFTFVTVRFVSFTAKRTQQEHKQEVKSILQYAQEQAIIDNTLIAVKLTNQGYVISELVPDKLTPDKNITLKNKVIRKGKYHTKGQINQSEQIIFNTDGMKVK